MNTRYGIYDQVNNGRQRRQSSMEDLEATIGGIEAKLDRMRGQHDTGFSPRDDMAERMRRISQEIEARQPAPAHRNAYAPVARPVADSLRTSGDSSGAMAAMVAELQNIRSEMSRLAAAGQQTPDWNNSIRKEMEAIKNGLGSLAREDTLRSVETRWNTMAQPSISGDPVIESMLERIEGIQTAVGNLPQLQTLSGFEEKIRVLANAVDQLSRRAPESNVNQLIQIEDRLDEISRAIVASSVSTPKGVDTAAFERLEARLASLNGRIDEIVNANHGQDLTKRIGFLSSQVEAIAARSGAPLEQMDRMTSQMEVIAARINELDRTKADPAAIAGSLEDRLYEIAARLEKNHEETGREAREIFNELEQRLEDMASRLNSLDSAQPSVIDNSEHILAAVERRFADLSQQLTDNQTGFSVDPAFAANIESRLDSINLRLNESTAVPSPVDPNMLARLEAQVQNLAAQLAEPRTDSDPYAVINPRLEAIEQSLAMSHDAIISAARQAAEDVLRQAQYNNPGTDNDLAIELANDLKALEALTRKSDERNTKTFEAIHDTLLKIVDRLNSAEAVKASVLPAEAAFEPFTAPAMPQTATLAPVPAKAAPVAPKLDLGMEAPALDVPDLAEEEMFESFAASTVRSPAEAALAAALAANQSGDKVTEKTASKSKGGFLSGLTAKIRRKEEGKSDLQLAGSSPFKEEPMLEDVTDPSLANSPIEPGSGTPDLNAIMKRVRDERRVKSEGEPGRTDEVAKNDFLAAARRAAQAAAADAEILRNKSTKSVKSSDRGLSALVQNYRKPIMLGMFAVLLAITGWQLKNAFQSVQPDSIAVSESSETPTIAGEQEPVVAGSANPAPALEGTDAGETAEAAVREVEPAQPSATADLASNSAEAPAVSPEATAPAADASIPPPVVDGGATQAATAPKAELPPVEYGPVPLREAAASGDAKAEFEIASRLADGIGMPKDLKKAADWYARSADQGFAPAQFRLGSFYEKGAGVERSAQKAKEYYQLAAEQGNASAMHNLAVLYATGVSGPVDNESAAKWFVKAAELGVKDSQYNLGILAAKGLGVKQSLEESYKWFALAAKAGDKDAASKRDEIANAMRPEQLKIARGATELWKAKPVDAASNSVEIPASWKTDGGQTTSTGATDPAQMTKAIRNIQAILNQQGFDAGAPDGKLGGKTKKAISAYQKANKMTVTGEVNEALIKSLLEKVKKPKA